MTFRCSCTFPISGPNKLLRFKQWAAANAPGIAFSAPPQVPVKSEKMTIRVRSIADRDSLMALLEGVKL
ncbi:hypothetical protein CYG48_18710 (plasmid) [Neorhizobium sp. SOG26]|nr:hypothetical protein CYG48_18710 [Neorhizobium sp. SOG26]